MIALVAIPVAVGTALDLPPLPARAQGTIGSGTGQVGFSGQVLVARGGRIPFEASCTRLGPGDKLYCRIDAILLLKQLAEARVGEWMGAVVCGGCGVGPSRTRVNCSWRIERTVAV